MGIACAGNLFTLFVFYEVLTLVTYPLVTHAGTDAARSGGRVYIGILMGTSIVLLLPALILIWVVAGTTDFTPGGMLDGKLSGAGLGALLALTMFGIGKAALMPVHRWLPAAMVAPTPVSALLHAVAVVKAGVFTVVKVIVYIFGVDNSRPRRTPTGWLSVAGFTIIAASIVALRADNLKRRLAYSTVSQLAYVVHRDGDPRAVVDRSAPCCTSPRTPSARSRSSSPPGRSTPRRTRPRSASSTASAGACRGRWRAFAVGVLSMIGLPPAAGFVSKWYMLSGAMASANWLAIAVIAASTLLNAGYFPPIVYRAFFVAPRADGAARTRRTARRRGRWWSRSSPPPPARSRSSSSRGAARARAADDRRRLNAWTTTASTRPTGSTTRGT